MSESLTCPECGNVLVPGAEMKDFDSGPDGTGPHCLHLPVLRCPCGFFIRDKRTPKGPCD